MKDPLSVSFGSGALQQIRALECEYRSDSASLLPEAEISQLVSSGEHSPEAGIRIPLTQGYHALVDAADYAELAQYNWHVLKIRKKLVYAVRGDYSGLKRKTVYMHRQISGARPDQVTDHRSGDTLDNRRCNLRACTQKQNSRNRIAVVSSSGFKGVQLMSGSWYANITTEQRRIWIGPHRTPEDAARAYDAAAIKHFGEFAATNEMLGRFNRA